MWGTYHGREAGEGEGGAVEQIWGQPALMFVTVPYGCAWGWGGGGVSRVQESLKKLG